MLRVSTRLQRHMSCPRTATKHKQPAGADEHHHTLLSLYPAWLGWGL